MSDANVVKLLQPGSFADPLTEVLRNGARALLAQAIEAEVAEFLAKHVDLKTATGLSRVVRHGHLPEREVMTGIGPVGVRQPRVRDRGAADDAGRIRFTPAILPPYARRSRSLEVLVPILYLKGISTGDFEEALAALLGKDAPGLSASTIARLKEVWIDEHEHWRKRDLSAKHYVYVWADGIYLQARLEDAKQCILVIIGATPEGRKELLGFTDGARESAQDWRELLLDLKNRGLAVAPRTRRRRRRAWLLEGARRAVADHTQATLLGADRNILNKLPKGQQPKAKRALQEIWMAETNKDAEAAFDAFIAAYPLKSIRPPSAWQRIARPCSHSMISLPNTGNTCGPRTRSRAPFPPCGTARSGRRAASRIRRRSPWCSSWSMRRRKAGAGSMATTSCPSSFKVSGSPTGSKSPPTPRPRNPKPPPPDP